MAPQKFSISSRNTLRFVHGSPVKSHTPRLKYHLPRARFFRNASTWPNQAHLSDVATSQQPLLWHAFHFHFHKQKFAFVRFAVAIVFHSFNPCLSTPLPKLSHQRQNLAALISNSRCRPASTNLFHGLIGSSNGPAGRPKPFTIAPNAPLSKR